MDTELGDLTPVEFSVQTSTAVDDRRYELLFRLVEAPALEWSIRLSSWRGESLNAGLPLGVREGVISALGGRSEALAAVAEYVERIVAWAEARHAEWEAQLAKGRALEALEVWKSEQTPDALRAVPLTC